MTSEITTLTHADWLALGTKLFGSDFMKWKFVCPGCGNVAAVEEFRQFKDQGADANSATNECIGRYSGGKWLDSKPTKPCNYAGYGLIQLSPVRVVQADGKEIHCFAFAEEPQT